MAKRQGTKNVTIPGFELVAFIFNGYFSFKNRLSFRFQVLYLKYLTKNPRQVMCQLKLVCQRPSFVKYNLMLTLKELCLGEMEYEEGVEIRGIFT